MERQSWDSVTLENAQSKRCVMVCVRKPDKIQDVQEMLQECFYIG